ncbi:SPOR domain-containing protein [Salinimonas chungwhensis]|uniref:SPOR domain-containing protein n=1 Tax=Salinimonas chungwhensis TaxID=265425 RepID=UPI0003607DDF|nr:SPOR domain-containing protein [Salinimonas chungwhensis]
MSSALQNRLVGTVIVVALAVIFLPDFLNGKKETVKTDFASVPATPAKKPIVEPDTFPSERVARAAQRPIEIVDDVAVDEPRPASQQTNAQASARDTSDDLAKQTVVNAPADAADDAGWVIQLGSFRHKKNVQQLLEKLEKAGYRTYSRGIRTNSGALTKVFVGPDLDKNKLENALPHLKELTGLRGKVTEFKVNQ